MRSSITLTSAIVLLCVAKFSNGTNKEDSGETQRHKRSFEGKRLRFVYILNEPYTMQKADGTFEGFVPDLVETLSRNLRFQYDAYLVPDGRYGSQDSDGNWNGMIKEVLDHEKDPAKGADIAAAPITVSASRLKHVDYIKPFQHTGLALVVKKPHLEEDADQSSPVLFQVLGPFTAGVWGLTILAVCVVGLLLWIMNLKNPYEWKSLYEMGKASENQGHLFNLPGAFWFTFSTLQWQGYEQAPRSISARALSCFWFAFVTLTLVTYTGSLMNYLFWASSIHAKSSGPPFHTLEELLLRKDYSYGTLKSGTTYNFITNNQNRLEYKRMTQYLQTPEGEKNLLSTSLDGIERARKGKFAFVMEDMSARHLVNKEPCDLMVAGEKFAPRSYGMVVSKQMPQELSNALHQEIMELHEMGGIEALERKWWIDRGECWNVTNEDRSNYAKYELNKPKKVTLKEFLGPLGLLLVGIVISIVVAVAEIFYYRLRGRYQKENTPGRTVLKPENGNIQA